MNASATHTHDSLPSTHQFIVFADRPNYYRGKFTRGVKILHINDADKFEFTSPAVTRVVYAAHPSNPQRLYPFASYDEELAKVKLAEALRMLGVLGASNIVAYAHRSKSINRDGSIGVPPFINAKVNFDDSDEWEVTCRIEGRGSKAQDPRPLLFPCEPGFDSACHAVLHNGARDVLLVVSSQSKFTADSQVGGLLRDAGFKLGGKVEKSLTNVFGIRATFPDPDSLSGACPEVSQSLRTAS